MPRRSSAARSWPLQALSKIVVFSLALSSAAGLGCVHAEQIQLNAQVVGDAQRTRFVAFLSKAVDFRIFEMTDPFRIVVDLPEADIQVPGAKERGLVLSSRSGLLSPGKSRIVIDLIEPALVEKSELLPSENGAPARLVIDLVKSSYKAFLAASKIQPPVPRLDAAKSPPAEDPADKRPLIVIDPGHGGVDAGALGRITKIPEKEITFDFCKDLKEKLEAFGRYRIVMTRDVDVFVPLDERADMASQRKADLLISIHADTLDVKRFGVKSLQEVRGGTVYTLSDEASDEQAKLIAQNENNADVQAGVANAQTAPAASAEIGSILSELESRGKKNRSMALANYLIEHLKDKMKFNIRPHRSANLRVLKSVGVPAILLELGYLSNDDDEKLLTSKEWRSATAASVADAVNAFMAERQAHMPL
jgi:N-acetylmuramoyl-L-alanine amidase